jgi:hypothetical protein
MNHDGKDDKGAQLAAEVARFAQEGQAAGLRLLLAEMQALAQVMPGAVAPHLAEEPQCNGVFDNLPI